eukprot:12617227-Alexandrium_andersonii.AAC.1
MAKALLQLPPQRRSGLLRDIVSRATLLDPRKYMAACICARLADLEETPPSSTARSRTPRR